MYSHTHILSKVIKNLSQNPFHRYILIEIHKKERLYMNTRVQFSFVACRWRYECNDICKTTLNEREVQINPSFEKHTTLEYKMQSCRQGKTKQRYRYNR